MILSYIDLDGNANTLHVKQASIQTGGGHMSFYERLEEGRDLQLRKQAELVCERRTAERDAALLELQRLKELLVGRPT